MGCETTQIVEEDASNNNTPDNQEEEKRFPDFEEIGSKY